MADKDALVLSAAQRAMIADAIDVKLAAVKRRIASEKNEAVKTLVKVQMSELVDLSRLFVV